MNWLAPQGLQSASSQYDIPNVSSPFVQQQTINAIRSAWDKFSFIDCYGRVWVSAEGCHVILRTSTANAKYLIGRLSDNEKYTEGDTLLIKGPAICKILDEFCYSAGSLIRENYIRYSQCVYEAIKHSSRARELRAQNYTRIGNAIGTLKNLRIKQYAIKHDELTGDVLLPNSQFSHIRSVAAYPQIATNVQNGLIVNATTHDVITSLGISDESELLELCKSQNWKLDWIYSYNQFLSSS